MSLKIMPQEIVDEYKLINLEVNGNVFIDIQKGMPALKQAGNIASDYLTTHSQETAIIPFYPPPCGKTKQTASHSP